MIDVTLTIDVIRKLETMLVVDEQFSWNESADDGRSVYHVRNLEAIVRCTRTSSANGKPGAAN